MNAVDVVNGSPYHGYVYAYPHKTAYRRIEPRFVSEVWREESRRNMFLYLHVPFCGMRCGFCNLFTQAKPNDALIALYLDTLEQESLAVRDALPDAELTRLAIGGGTPTYLAADQLERVFAVIRRFVKDVPSSIEVSPETVTTDKLKLMRLFGIDRVSIGIQSFVEAETRASGRPQHIAEVIAALDQIRAFEFPTLNVDLIYGLPGQTVETWLHSVHRTLEWHPEELYLYPLYVRPLTGLGRSHREWDDIRLTCYRAARDVLLMEGYRQVSMRMFRKIADSRMSLERSNHVRYRNDYCCQTDGMLGLGCGARSYTRSLHYSGEYAVSAKGVRAVLADYIAREPADFREVRYGFVLDEDEQRRRFVLQSLLHLDEGLNLDQYRNRFGTEALIDLPALTQLEPNGFANLSDNRLSLTAAGVERSDAIGPFLFSDRVRRLMQEYELR